MPINQKIYFVQGTPTTDPIVDYDRSRLQHFEAAGMEIHELNLRASASALFPTLFEGLAQMAHRLIGRARDLGVEIELHLEIREQGASIVITEGKAELLAAIKVAIDHGPSYATGILRRDAINFGSMLDLDIALDRAFELRAKSAAASAE